MKTLKTSKLLLAIFFGSLMNIKTDQFQTDDEMEQYRNKLKPALESVLEDYRQLWDRAKEINRQRILGELDEGKIQELIRENNKNFIRLDTLNENKKVELELEDADFNLLFDLFTRFGKKAFLGVDKYLDFKEDLNEANKQPKQK